MSHTNPADVTADVVLPNQPECLPMASRVPEEVLQDTSTCRQLLWGQQLQEDEEEAKEEQPAAEAEAGMACDAPQEDGKIAEQPAVESPDSERTATATSPTLKAAPKSWADLVRTKNVFSAFMRTADHDHRHGEDDPADAGDDEDIDPAVDSSADDIADGGEWDNLSRASSSSLDEEDADDKTKMRMTWDEEELERRQRHREREALTERVDASEEAIRALNGACETHNDMLAKLLDFEYEVRRRVERAEKRVGEEWQELCNCINRINYYLEPDDHRVDLRRLAETSHKDILELESFRDTVKQKNMEFAEQLEAQKEKTSSAVKSLGMLDVSVVEIQNKLTELLNRVSGDATNHKSITASTMQLLKRHHISQNAHDAKLKEQAESISDLQSTMVQEAKDAHCLWERQRDEQGAMVRKLDELETLHNELVLSQTAGETKTKDKIQDVRASMISYTNSRFQSSLGRFYRKFAVSEEKHGAELAHQADRTNALEDKVQALCDKLEKASGRIQYLESENEGLKTLVKERGEVRGDKVQSIQEQTDANKPMHTGGPVGKMNSLGVSGINVDDRLNRISNLRAEVLSWRMGIEQRSDTDTEVV